MSEKINYENFVGGRVDVVQVPCGSGTFKKGDVLECACNEGVASETFAKATDVKVGNAYVVCGEDVTLSGNGKVVAYKGYIQFAKVNDANPTAKQLNALIESGIFVL